MITESNKIIIRKVVNVFETGTPEGKYDELVIYPDGENNAPQITYGRSQTTEQGNLRELIIHYTENEGIFSEELGKYIPRIGRESLVNDTDFKELLVRAAREDRIMRETQDEFFDRVYLDPSIHFFDENKFTRPLSLLVIYDSYIHSGHVPKFLRSKFAEYPPARGGDEKKWTTAYVEIRHSWLENNPNLLLRKTIYRTQCFKDQIASDNWDLDKLPIIANGVPVS